MKLVSLSSTPTFADVAFTEDGNMVLRLQSTEGPGSWYISEPGGWKFFGNALSSAKEIEAQYQELKIEKERANEVL